jgi:hypothetical protein
MAYVAMGGTHVTGGVAGTSFQEGIAVVITASGLHDDLPTVLPATAGARNVFIAIVPPDLFPRPTPVRMFNRNQYITRDAYANLPLSVQGLNPTEAVEYLIESGQRGAHYLIGPSVMQEPTIYSGWAVQLHKGGAYTLTAGAYTDSADIRVIGATVAVGTGGKFVYSTSAAAIVGYVREYRDGRLTIVLDQRSA